MIYNFTPLNENIPFMIQENPNHNLTWTKFDDKLFEKALVDFPDDVADRWQRIALQLPGKTADDVRIHYEHLVYDVAQIDSGRVELPNYADDETFGWDQASPANQISFGSSAGKSKHAGEGERKKGNPWTEDEHRRFLIGLEKYGKGDWRSISRNVVVTRTATQVASHAQKYFLRRAAVKKERKRSSIHDITTPLEAKTETAPSPNSFSNQGGLPNCNFPDQG